jgi:hypothetical protein
MKLGLPPSSATNAVNSIWKHRNDFFDKKEIFAILFPADDRWTTVLCWQSEPGGALYKLGRADAPRGKKVPLPDQAFAVVPISATFARIAKRLDGLLEGSKEPPLENKTRTSRSVVDAC